MILLCFFSCEEKPKQIVSIPKDEMKNSMEKANRYLLNEEEEEIDSYVRRHGMEMVSTGTGLRYQILKHGSGNQINNGDKVMLDYELRSLTGDLIYSSENEGVKEFSVGDGSVEAGLDEAMKLLHYGDVAKLIVPFHLAYGLHGDDNRIGEYTTLVYTIKVNDNQ